MALIKGTIPVVDEYLIKAVKYALDQLGIHPDTLPQKKRRTSLDGIGYGGSGYNGYFTIKLRTLENGTQKLVVCDGETYDSTKNTSEESIVRVNQVEFPVPYTELEILNGKRHLVIIYTPPQLDAEGNVIGQGNQSVHIEAITDVVNEKRPHYLIGSYTKEADTVKIIQRHGTAPTNYMSNGIADMEYFIICE